MICEKCLKKEELQEEYIKSLKPYKLYRVVQTRVMYVYADSSKAAVELEKEAEYNPLEIKILRPTIATRKQVFKDEWDGCRPYSDDQLADRIGFCEDLVKK